MSVTNGFTFLNSKERFADSLYGNILPEERSSGFFFVQLTSNFRYYRRCNTFLDFFQFQADAKHKHFDEVIPANFNQKCRFDIDIYDTETSTIFQQCLEALVDVLRVELPQLILETDLIVTTSNGRITDGYKWSGHIIVNNYFHLNSAEAQYFGTKIISKLPTNLQPYFDAGIWSPNHCLRILGQSKPGSTRIKQFADTWQYKDATIKYRYPQTPINNNHRMVMQLEASLVTVCASMKHIYVNMPVTIKRHIDYGDLSEEQATVAMEVFIQYAHSYELLRRQQSGQTIASVAEWKPPFKMGVVNGSLITLTRKKASYCPVHQRMHETIDQYLVIQGQLDIDPELGVMWGCYREKRPCVFVGSFANPEVAEATDKREVDIRVADIDPTTLKTISSGKFANYSNGTPVTPETIDRVKALQARYGYTPDKVGPQTYLTESESTNRGGHVSNGGRGRGRGARFSTATRGGARGGGAVASGDRPQKPVAIDFSKVSSEVQIATTNGQTLRGTQIVSSLKPKPIHAFDQSSNPDLLTNYVPASTPEPVSPDVEDLRLQYAYEAVVVKGTPKIQQSTIGEKVPRTDRQRCRDAYLESLQNQVT